MADVAQVFERVADGIAGLTTAIGVQGVSNVIKTFKGDPKQFKEWVKSIEKYVLMVGTPQDKVNMVAFQSSEGPVSDFIQRYLAANPNHNWDQLKAELKARFSEVTDNQHALTLLKHVKQGKDENVQIYAERLLTLAVDAYEGMAGGLNAADIQLIGFFVDGLAHDYLKMKVMRENPQNFQAAVASAMREQNLRKRFNLRAGYDEDKSSRQYASKSNPEPVAPRNEEPMEIDHLRPARKCERCGRYGHTARECRARWPVSSVNEVSGSKPNPAYGQGRSQGQRLCWVCNSPDHMKRDCPDRRQRGGPRLN